jgi:hypothetical protein
MCASRERNPEVLKPQGPQCLTVFGGSEAALTPAGPAALNSRTSHPCFASVLFGLLVLDCVVGSTRCADTASSSVMHAAGGVSAVFAVSYTMVAGCCCLSDRSQGPMGGTLRRSTQGGCTTLILSYLDRSCCCDCIAAAAAAATADVLLL